MPVQRKARGKSLPHVCLSQVQWKEPGKHYQRILHRHQKEWQAKTWRQHCCDPEICRLHGSAEMIGEMEGSDVDTR